MKDSRRKAFSAGGLVLVGALLGSLLGPPIASAVGSIVTIQGSGSSSKAKVTTSGRLEVDTGGVGTQSFPCGPNNKQCTGLDVVANGGVAVSPSGDTLIGSGTAAASFDCGGVVEAVTVDNTGNAASTVSLSAVLNSGGGGGGGGSSVGIWQATVPPAGHVNDTFGTGGVNINQLTVTETGSAQWYVYGLKFCQNG
jgi:hypothetical protein